MSGHPDSNCEENLDISPGARGNAALGYYNGAGFALNRTAGRSQEAAVFETGQDLASPMNTPLCNLYKTMLGALGVETESIGDSNGVLQDVLVSERDLLRSIENQLFGNALRGLFRAAQRFKECNS